MTRTSIMACLVVFAASGAMAQTSAGKAGSVNLDPGSSGGTAGLISGGGTLSSNLDARDNRPTPDTRTSEQRKQAKADSDAKEDRATSNARSKAARARAEADDEEKSSRARRAKQQRLYGYPYIFPNGFATFGTRSYPRSRD